MTPVTDANAVASAVQAVKARGGDFRTNFFPSPKKLQTWIEHTELFIVPHDELAVFLRRDCDFWHLYFAGDLQALPSLAPLNSKRIMVDLIGTEAALIGLLVAFETAGFRRYTRLLRMARTESKDGPAKSEPPDSRVRFAELADCEPILDLLCQSFNRYAEQLPQLYELEAAVKDRQILIANDHNTLAGLLYFETQGFTSLMRYWLIAEAYRDRHFGSVLIRRYLTEQNIVRRFILWVIDGNENAFRKYQHYGYSPDGLVDQVMANPLIHS